MASDTDTATPEPGRRFGLQGLRARIAAALGHREEAAPRAPSAETPSLLRRRRSATRRYSPLTRRILLLNIIPVALLTLGAVYLSDYEEELIDAELASLAVQGEMVAAGIGEVA
ncbi:MAG TPA: sensor N-terminal transmembrane domain-containing protein, partial [Reyranella sp.]|nr:sensor N-terminal transmembrane domain-containing protein [Reyranella sp.]